MGRVKVLEKKEFQLKCFLEKQWTMKLLNNSSQFLKMKMQHISITTKAWNSNGSVTLPKYIGIPMS